MNKINRVAVIGSGSWGTTIAHIVAINCTESIIISRNQQVIKDINDNSLNQLYLPNIHLADNVIASDDFSIINTVNLIFIAVPSEHLREAVLNMRNFASNCPIVICSKGIENDSLMLLSEVVNEILPNNEIAILSGPNLALEIAQNKPASSSIASKNKDLANIVAATISNNNFSTNISNDIITLQICGATKNILAIASGIIIGKKLGDNARAVVITKGINEIARLAKAKGGKTNTIFELGGIGDIFLTCNSLQSRNTSLGIELANNKSLNDILKNRSSVAEGVNATKAIYHLANKLAVDMPICTAIYDILYKNCDIQNRISKLIH